MKKVALITAGILSAAMMFGCLQDDSVSISGNGDVGALKKVEICEPPLGVQPIVPGYIFEVGVPVYSYDQTVKIVFQSDGNFVVYKNGKWIAQSKTYNHIPRADRAIFQVDGNLVLYKGTRPVWNSQTWGLTKPLINITNNGFTINDRGTNNNWCNWWLIQKWSSEDSSYFKGYTFPNW